MTNKTFILSSTLVIALVTVFPKTGVAQTGIAKTQARQEYQQQLTHILDSLQDVTGVPGFSVSVVHKGNIIASATTGFSDIQTKTPVNKNTQFRLASVSKIVGATMLGELVTHGKLSPDAAIGSYFPELSTKYHNITLNELMSHTSGMPHYQAKDYDVYDTHYATAKQALTTLKDRDLLTRPGYEYHYSTHGFTLAGAIAENTLTTPLPQALSEFIQRWTGSSTPVAEDIRQASPYASTLYELTPQGPRAIKRGEKSYSIFGAGMLATSDDLARFGYSVLNKAKGNSKLKNLLFTPTKTKDGTVVADRDFEVGFGWRIATDLYGRKVYHHAGATPGARSVLVIYPEYDLSIAFLSNSSWVSSIEQLAFAMASLYLDEAKALEFSAINYRVSQGDTTVSGNATCNRNQCSLADNKTEFTAWLNTFNRGIGSISNWPIITYRVRDTQRLLMINKIGITTFEKQNGVFETNIKQANGYRIQLQQADSGSNLTDAQ